MMVGVAGFEPTTPPRFGEIKSAQAKTIDYFVSLGMEERLSMVDRAIKSTAHER